MKTIRTGMPFADIIQKERRQDRLYYSLVEGGKEIEGLSGREAELAQKEASKYDWDTSDEFRDHKEYEDRIYGQDTQEKDYY